VPDKLKALHFTICPADTYCPVRAASGRFHAGPLAMNAHRRARRPPIRRQHVNELNPWLGLSSFDEETRAYFYGRDERSPSSRRPPFRQAPHGALVRPVGSRSRLPSCVPGSRPAPPRPMATAPSTVRHRYFRDPRSPPNRSIRRSPHTRRSGEWTRAASRSRGNSACGISAPSR